VLKAFVDADGRLKQIPASRKKRGAVLRWLMRDFAPGPALSEGRGQRRDPGASLGQRDAAARADRPSHAGAQGPRLLAPAGIGVEGRAARP
jgi:hypothetical protein